MHFHLLWPVSGLASFAVQPSHAAHSGIKEQRVEIDTCLPLRGQHTFAAALKSGLCFPFNCAHDHARGHQSGASVCKPGPCVNSGDGQRHPHFLHSAEALEGVRPLLQEKR
ncbi:MAG: hypothetical protein K0S28_537 [Paucimonas sp.]|jgi:hypothetical protein|nr:hypothetical protein [Paucimonas sp.]